MFRSSRAIIEDAYRRFSNERFPLPSETALAQLEDRTNIRFPADYRDFVLRFNGGHFDDPEVVPTDEECPHSCLTCLYGIGASYPTSELGSERSLSLFEDNDPPQIVPIGRTTMGGLIILIVVGEESGSIMYKQPYGDFFYLADGIEEFFGLLREPEDVES